MYTQTRLTRSSHDKVIGGVCGGLAQYFGVDAVIVRLIFVALVMAGGMSVVLYPILWLIMPAPETGRPPIADGWGVIHQVRGQVGESAQALRSSIGNAYNNAQPRFDPQTGQPLPVAGSRNSVLGIVLLGIGFLLLASMIPGGSSFATALMLLGGGFYLLRRNA